MLIDDIVARLALGVPSLANRVKGALDLTEMLRQKALPNYTPAGFVLHNGLMGGAAAAADSAYVQAVDEMVSIVLVQRTAGDVSGSKGQAPLHALVYAVILLLAGWAPDPDPDAVASGTDPIGVLELRRGRVVSLDAGTVFYQLDFAIAQQLRVLT